MMAENIKVSGKRGWLTGNIDNSFHRMLDESIKHTLLTTSAWWINYQSIKLRRQHWQKLFDFAFEYLNIAHMPQIFLGILNSTGRLFNRNHSLHVACQEQSKRSHSTI